MQAEGVCAEGGQGGCHGKCFCQFNIHVLESKEGSLSLELKLQYQVQMGKLAILFLSRKDFGSKSRNHC